MRTPTPRNRSSSGRGISTLIGNGWLRESPRARDAAAGWGWNARSKSALRKCMFLPVPDELRHLAPQVFQAAMLPQASPAPRAPEPEIVAHRHDPRKDAREFPAFLPHANAPANAHANANAIHVQNAHKAARQQAVAAAAGRTPHPWWEDPIALGSLLILAPPIGLAAVWSSKRYSSDARWALTIMTALAMCLMTAVVIAALVMR